MARVLHKEAKQLTARRLCKGMTLVDYAWLCRYDALLANVHAVNADPMAAIVPDISLHIAWPVVLMLGAHSGKHVYVHRQPDAWMMMKCVVL
jgi:hypothetical protein